MYLAGYTGKGVQIAVIDSGVHATHPHVGGVAGGFGIREDWTLVDDYRERLGAAVTRARAHGAVVVAAHDEGGVRWLPGCLEGVVSVRADASLDRGAYEVSTVDDRPVLVTAPF